MAKNRDYRNETGRTQRPMTKKEVTIQLVLCIAIIVGFTLWDQIFPPSSATPTPSATPVITQSGETMLDAAAVEALDLKLPTTSKQWRVFVIKLADGSLCYTLASENLENITYDNLARGGYEVAQSVRVNVRDDVSLTALLKHVPTGDTVTVIGANGLVVDTTTYAQVTNAANKSGLTVKMGEWTQPVVTITPSPTA